MKTITRLFGLLVAPLVMATWAAWPADDAMRELDHPWSGDLNNGLYSTITVPGAADGTKPKNLKAIKLTVPDMKKSIVVQAVIQPAAAPLVVLPNGTFGWATDSDTLMWMAWLEECGFHVLSYDSTFLPSMTNCSRHGMAGNLEAEADLAAKIIDTFLKQPEISGKVVQIGVAGRSYGAIQALLLAAKGDKLPFHIDAVQAYSPPVSLRGALGILDHAYLQEVSPLEYAGRFSGLQREHPRRDHFEQKEMYDVLAMVFRGGRKLAGLSAVVERNDELFGDELEKYGAQRLCRKNNNALNNDDRWTDSEATNFGKYLSAVAAFWKGRGIIKSDEDLLAAGELRSILARCKTGPGHQNVEVIVAVNDPLNEPGAVEQLARETGDTRVTVLPRGGHLGYYNARWTKTKLGHIFMQRATGETQPPKDNKAFLTAAAEHGAWLATAKAAKTAYEGYLGQHPEGKHADEAREKLADVTRLIADAERKAEEAAAKQEARRKASLEAEKLRWNTLRDSLKAALRKAKEDLAAYVKEHPNEIGAAEAREKLARVTERLAEFERAEAEELQPATGKAPVDTQAPMAMRAPSVWDGKESSADYARRCGLEPTKTLDLGDGMKLELVLVPAGRFTMGSADAEDGRSSDERQHQVTLSRPFYAGKYEVTQAQFQKVMASNPSKYAGDDRPVERVAWATAKEFCRRLGESTKTAVDLPTEAEWEFACRAGTDMRYYAGQTKESLATAGWYTDNSDGTTHPVGRKVGNSFGLYDMIGNVWEWCNDWYGEYPRDSVTDPGGPASGSQRIIRGGSWWSYSWKCRSAARDDFGVNSLDSTVGFRVVVRVAPTK